MESAKHRAVLAVYRNASPVTKPYYQHAHYVDGRNEENWAIQWCLWHSFRMFRNNSGARLPRVELETRQPDATDGAPSTENSSGASERCAEPVVQPGTPAWSERSGPAGINGRYTGTETPDSPSWRSTGECYKSLSRRVED